MTILRNIACHSALTMMLLGPMSAAAAGDLLELQTPAAKPAVAPAGDKLSVPFSDPGRPGTLRVTLTTGGIRVRGYQGQNVLIETSSQDEEKGERPERQGLRRLRNTASGLVVEEERNEMRISSDSPNRAILLEIQVPVRTSLVLSTVNDGDIIVDGVDGEIELNNTNGAVTATKVSGSVIAHALNEDVKVTLARAGTKPMSFTSLNGDVDVVLPADIKANVRMQTGNGEIYSDFAIDMLPASVQQTTEGPRAQGGKYRIKVEQTMIGRINGGGPEITFKTFNGDIRIRKGS